MKVQCTRCNVKLKKGTKHYCKVTRSNHIADDEDDGFIESAFWGFITDSWLLGWAFGGNPLGSLLADALHRADVALEEATLCDPAGTSSEFSDDVVFPRLADLLSVEVAESFPAECLTPERISLHEPEAESVAPVITPDSTSVYGPGPRLYEAPSYGSGSSDSCDSCGDSGECD
jgi:hypothetical protein